MLQAIAGAFSGLCPVYADDVPQGVKKPCVCVRVLEETRRLLPGGVLERYVECVVTLHGVPIDEAERLRVLSVGRASSLKIAGEQVRAVYRLRTVPAETGDLMKELVLQ